MMTNLLFSQLTAIGKRFAMVLTMLLMLGVTQVWGALSSPYTCTFTTNLTLNNKQVKTGDVTWTLSTTDGKGSPTTTFGNTNGQSAIKLGSGKNNYYSKMTLTTSAFSSYNITKVVLYISSNNGGSKTITVKQGNIQIGTGNQTFSSTAWVTNCTRNTTKGSGGDLSIEISSDATATFIHSIAITYEETIATKTLSSISVSGQTTTYNVGDAFLFDGTCTAKYSDNSTKTVTPTSVSLPNMSNAGEKTITVSYTEDGITKTTNYTITVTEASSGGDDACDKWVEVDLSDIQSTDDVVITMTNGTTTWALTDGNGTSDAPVATILTINSDKSISDDIISDAIKWNISNDNGSLTIYPTGQTKNWLYCTATNNGVRVGTNENKTFTIEISKQDNVDYNYLKNTGTSRYLGVYTTNPDWRCYTTATSNNAKQTLKFYKKVCGSTEPTVTLNPNGGTFASDPPEGWTKDGNNYKKEDVTGAITLPTPTKTGYNFDGWYDDEIKVNSPYTPSETVTLTAKWTAIQTTITLNANEGSGNTPSVAATYDSSTLNPSSITNPTKTGHTFGGWYSDEGGTGSLVINSSGKLQANVSGFTGTNGVWKATTNKTLYAKWTPAVYAINYKDQGDADFSGQHEAGYPQNHTYNTETTLKSASKEHYTFGGWYKENDCSGTEVTTLGATEYTDEITLYAKWTANTYTITFNAGTGECDTESVTTTNASGVTLPTATHTCTDWDFAGWAETSVTEKTTAPTLLAAGDNYKPTSAITLYAVYSKTETTQGGGENIESSAIISWSESTLSFSGNGWNSNTSKGYSGNYLRLDENQQYVSYSASTGTVSQIKFTYKLQSSTACTGHKDQAWWIGDIELYGSINSGSSWSKIDSKCISVNSGDNLGKDISVTYNDLSSEGYNAIKIQFAKECGNLAIKGLSATSGGGSTTTTTYNSNPVCVASWSITYDFAGGTGSHCSNTSVPQGEEYTICDEAPTKEGHTFLGWSDGINTYQPNNSFTPTSDITLTAQWQVNTYIVTWNNNGVTTPIEYNHGETLEVPATPASCDGVKEFVGWTEQSGYYHATDAPTDLFETTTATVTADATYYAVFATPPTTGGGSSIETTDDVLTRETTEVASGSTNYVSWSGKTAESSAVYAGNSAGGNDAIQLRSNNSNSGIVTTTSGGKATRVEVDWESNTASDRTLDIYGRNVAYSAATDLYSTSTQGTKLGSIICGTSTELEITGDYEYIGLRSNSGAMYLTSVTITWSSAGGSSSHTDYTTICQEVTGIAISGSYPTTFVQYDSFSFAGGIVTATFENGSTQDVTSLATFSDYNMDEVGVQTVTVTYMGQTAKYEITITESDRWRLTWNVSGKTNTGASPIYVQQGSAIGTLPTPEVPAACAGKTFMGWTESNIVPSDGKGIVYITEETVPSKNTTYYAVFATINNFSTQAAIEDIKSDSKVVIVAVASMDASGGAGQAISSRTISITKQGVIGLSGDEVSIFDETINTPHSTCIWTLTKEGGGIVFEQGGKYIRAVNDEYRKLLLETTKDYWTLSPVEGKDKTYHMQSGNTSHYVEWFDHTDSKYDEGERYIGFVPYTAANDNGDFDMQFYVTANADGNADITDYTTGCEEYTITYYGFRGGYSTSCSSDGTIVLPVNSLHTVPNCGDVVTDHTNLGREFLNVWMTQPHGGHTFKPGDTFILTQDTTLYAQWEMETTSDVTTLPTDIEDLAGTDIYVYGGKTLNIQPGTTTINSLTLKGGIQEDGSYKMPTVWVPEGATLVRNSNKIYLDLKVNAKNYYPFAVPFRAKNGSAKANWDYVGYINPVLKEAATYRTHFVIKTYDGAKRADKGENRDANWAIVNRDTYLEPGVGYMITAMTYAGTDTVTIRIPMSVSNTWFKNGEQAEVGTTVRNTIAVTAHAGEAATEHQRHAGWNFVANPYLTSFTGGNVANDDGLAYINGELIIEGSYVYGGDPVPYVTIPAYDFAYYSQHKLSDVKLSPEWSFFVQVGTGGTMNFTTAGRQQAPAHLAARAAEQPIKMDVDITLSDDNHSDQTGLIICDRFSDAYEIGHDLEKMFGSAYNLSVYTLMADNTPLAFQALAIQNSMQVIPVGYRTPAQGEYTFALNEATSDIELLNEQYEQLILVDYETGALTNMLNNEYTFYSDRTQSNNRFALYAVLRQNTTTDLPNTIGNEEVKKVIYNDHFYILRDGKVFNGAGQIVK